MGHDREPGLLLCSLEDAQGGWDVPLHAVGSRRQGSAPKGREQEGKKERNRKAKINKRVKKFYVNSVIVTA